uniref:FYVE and coiled-coil domain autophagy adaptor 1b n=1 Tax=Cyprinodon variegatus TaxID=28743 RepID=A0A3Q2DLU7_CYPVA
MASSSSVGDKQLQRIIRDLHDAVIELCKEHKECGEPITDDSSNLHKFFYKLEYLLQFDQKERTTFLGQRKDYWDYFCDCLIKIKGANDGIRFVKSIPELKTSLGKGRAFIRYSLVHQRLADTLQQCFINQKATSDWYYARSPFLKSYITAEIINDLYELNQIQFDVAPRGYDLDADWPSFARRTLGATSQSLLWKPPSRCSSINSLVGSNSHSQVIHFCCLLLKKNLKSLVKHYCCFIATDKRSLLSCNSETGNEDKLNISQSQKDLQERLQADESKSMELLSKLDEALSEKGQQTASYRDSAWKIHELLERLKTAEEDRSEKLNEVKARAHVEREEALARLEELQSAVGRIQGALTLKEKETGNLRAQLQDVQASLDCRERQAEELRKRLQEEVEERCGLSYEELEDQMLELRKTLKSKEKDLTARSEKIKHLEEQLEKLNAERELAALKASEKQLKSRVEAAKMNVADREKKLLDENLQLEETLQKIVLQNEVLEAQVKRLQQENEKLLDSHSSMKERLTATQQELDFLDTKANVLTNNLTGSQRGQAEVLEKLNEAEANLKAQTVKCALLQARVEELESRTMHHEKGAAESNEKMQNLQTASLDTKEAPIRLVIAEAQLELNQREVARLREEVVELRAQLLAGNEEKIKVQALQEVTAASREDLRILSDQLKAQVEELNRHHVDEILRSREREEALIRERDGEAQARVGLAAEVTASREEVDNLKLRCEALRLENSESQEALHRANTETAELGVHVCMLTAQNEEARLRWEGLSSRLQELEESSAQEAERLSTRLEQLRQENQELRSQLDEKEDLLLIRQKLQSEAQQKAETGQKTNQEEIQALRLQLSSQATDHENQLKAENQRYSVTWCACVLGFRSEEALAAAQRACQEMAENLRLVKQDKKSFDLKTAAELDDLYRTKINLEERLVELIREKDVLWQKSDALEFEQKLRDEETERDVNYCLGCNTQFSWWLRKYNCRLCGRPFCYYCCSNTVSTQLGGNRERCCTDCYNQHSLPHNTPGSPFSRLLQTGRSLAGIAGETSEVVPVESKFVDILTQISTCSISCVLRLEKAFNFYFRIWSRNNSSSIGDLTSEDAEDTSAAVQDAEICLLKSGELTLSVCLTVDDLSEFGESSRELFIKSSCYSIIPITMTTPGSTVSWTFTSEPKSISFSVVYRESAETPLEQAKVLIPLTRCNSHKETIQGELKVRNQGEYILIFDNSFSRFISKKVLYHLSLDKPVVYEGAGLL